LVRATIEQEPLARIDYVSVNTADTFEKLDKIDERPALLSLAVFIGKTRLIDNEVLGKTKKQDAAGA
jgi:pantoate--beta-alanine ligase